MDVVQDRFRVEEWPHGLRCCDCDHSFLNGEAYGSRLEAVTQEGIPVTVIACVVCLGLPF